MEIRRRSIDEWSSKAKSFSCQRKDRIATSPVTLDAFLNIDVKGEEDIEEYGTTDVGTTWIQPFRASAESSFGKQEMSRVRTSNWFATTPYGVCYHLGKASRQPCSPLRLPILG